MTTYVIERRRTVGAYKLMTVCSTEAEAKACFEEAIKQTSEMYPELTMISPKPKDMVGCINWIRFGKSSHNNIILRLRRIY